MKIYKPNVIVIAALLCNQALFVKADFWTQKASFPPGGRCAAFSFVIDNKGYVGCGRTGPTAFHKDFWKYDPDSNIWTQLADFPGSPRLFGSAFVINNKGYAGLGMDTTYFGTNDFYEFDPNTNIWTQKANFGGTNRFAASSFSADSLGFVGMGSTIVNTFTLIFHNDLWAYDPVTDTWAQKASLPSTARTEATAFRIGSKGYLAAGGDSTGYLSELWEYDTNTDSWAQKASLPGTAVGRADLASFSLGSSGYICTGQTGPSTFTKQCFKFNPVLNQWIQMANFPAPARDETIGFSIGSHAYAGLGGHNSIPAYSDFWEYTPDHDSTTNTSTAGYKKPEITVFPNPSSGRFVVSCDVFENKSKKLKIFDASGNCVYYNEFQKTVASQEVNLPKIPPGSYMCALYVKNKIVAYKKIEIIK